MLLGIAHGGDGWAQTVGVVVRQEGQVVALQEERPRALHVGAEVERGDRVRTGSDARLRIEGGNGLVLVIGPSTDILIERYASSERGFLELACDLLFGIARLIVPPGPDATGGATIETSTAIASVRSTDWLVDVTAKGTGVFVAQGSVAVTSKSGGSVVLQPLEGTDVPPGGPPSPPRIWGDARRDEALARTGL